MTKEHLATNIEARFKTRLAFVLAFNEKAGFAALDETTISRQISGNVLSSAFAQVAFIFYFSDAHNGGMDAAQPS